MYVYFYESKSSSEWFFAREKEHNFWTAVSQHYFLAEGNDSLLFQYTKMQYQETQQYERKIHVLAIKNENKINKQHKLYQLQTLRSNFSNANAASGWKMIFIFFSEQCVPGEHENDFLHVILFDFLITKKMAYKKVKFGEYSILKTP